MQIGMMKSMKMSVMMMMLCDDFFDDDDDDIDQNYCKICFGNKKVG